MTKKPVYYISTPLYYPSGNWHLGHSYTTVCCDAIARYKRMSGFDVFFLTGTDEHGQKIELRATEANLPPKTFVDGLVASIKKLWERLDISYDKFIRTTDDYHVQAVQKIFTMLYEKGDIYKSSYKGKYCVPCEAFWTDTQLVDGKCPDCGREVIQSEEECYFFRLSKYEGQLRKLLEEGDFLEPKSRVNEMINNFLGKGLTDLAVTRSSVNWGIKVPFDPKHTIYVWIDALTNYINALGYASPDETLFNKYWPCSLHMVGKEIVRFHSIVWPALLMALGLKLPEKVYGHGWLLLKGDKMSKSKGNVADPFVLIDRYGIDPVRYYLLREIPFGSDGAYTDESFLTRYNTDLVNDLGNLVKRSVAMASQYFNGKITDVGEQDIIDGQFLPHLTSLKDKVEDCLSFPSCSKALTEIFSIISKANKYIDETKPWILFKENKLLRLNRVLYNLLETIRICSTLLIPFLREGPVKIFESLNLPLPGSFDGIGYGFVKSYNVIPKDALYRRVDISKELNALAVNKEPDEEIKEEKNTNMISIDDFFKTELKVAEVLECERVPKTDKLLKLKVKVGEEIRTVVSGIAKSYTPEEMIGKQVVLVSNLQPAKLRGIESEGMILCASDGDNVVLVSPEKTVDSGSEVC